MTGIFVEDILDAVPIDKWFEMFKPAAAGEGGFIRVHMSFSEENPAHASNTSTLEPATPTGGCDVTCQDAFRTCCQSAGPKDVLSSAC